jgi:putative transcriptional regulator
MSNKNYKFDVSKSLQGKFLISTPSMVDNRFFKSVLLITNHSKDGALGIVINKPSAHTFSNILKSVNPMVDIISTNLGDQKINIVMGGPINPTSLFVVHSPEYAIEETIKVDKIFSYTNHSQIVFDLSKGNGPKNSIIAIGCATWTAGQIEAELATDSWVLADVDESILFQTPTNKIYDKITNDMGLKESNSAFYSYSTTKN